MRCLSLDGLDVAIEEHSSTLHGSRGVRRTMLEANKTVARDKAFAHRDRRYVARAIARAEDRHCRRG